MDVMWLLGCDSVHTELYWLVLVQWLLHILSIDLLRLYSCLASLTSNVALSPRLQSSHLRLADFLHFFCRPFSSVTLNNFSNELIFPYTRLHLFSYSFVWIFAPTLPICRFRYQRMILKRLLVSLQNVCWGAEGGGRAGKVACLFITVLIPGSIIYDGRIEAYITPKALCLELMLEITVERSKLCYQEEFQSMHVDACFIIYMHLLCIIALLSARLKRIMIRKTFSHQPNLTLEQIVYFSLPPSLFFGGEQNWHVSS